MPSVSGSAAVPSTVDIYVNNLKTYSQDVGTGPYQINNLPLSGGGTARIVGKPFTPRELLDAAEEMTVREDNVVQLRS